MTPIKVALFLALVAVVAVTADERPSFYRPPSYRGDSSEEDDDGSYEDAKYEFEWQVDEDSNEFGHQEQRDGDETQGSYYVVLPDGRTQKVTYYVDGDSGYVAEVSYSGEAHYSEESSEEYEKPRRRYN